MDGSHLARDLLMFLRIGRLQSCVRPAFAVFSLATGSSINIYRQIEVLMLIGIMAKIAITMFEFANQLCEQGRTVLKAAWGSLPSKHNQYRLNCF